MSTQEKQLYNQITVKGNKFIDYGVGSKTYTGFSTIDPEKAGFKLYDLELIKQDIINHFHIRQGENLSDPTFGTIIWDVLFEPLTERLKEAIAENVSKVINYDPRVSVDSVTVDQYESGIQIEATLIFKPYNIQETLRLNFDQNAGFVSS